MRRILSGLLIFAAAVAPALAGEVLRDLKADSPALGKPLIYSAYLPDGPTRGLPAVYLLHGRGGIAAEWLDQARAHKVADRLIAERRMPRAILVMPEAGNSWYVDSVPGGPGAYATAIARDLTRGIEARFGALDARNGRALAGNSMGGFGALRLALNEPDRFAAAASMSGAFWTRIDLGQIEIDEQWGARLVRIFAGAFGDPFDRARFLAQSPYALTMALPNGAPLPAFYLTVGREDGFRLAAEQPIMSTRLEAIGAKVESTVAPGDHNWDTWKAALPGVLEFLGRHLDSGR